MAADRLIEIATEVIHQGAISIENRFERHLKNIASPSRLAVVSSVRAR